MWASSLFAGESKRAMSVDAAKFIVTNTSVYKQVGDAFGIPFYVIGAIHYRESSFDFTTHLANGDPLFDSTGTAIATTHVPSGLGPFDSWTSGAIGAIKEMKWGSSWHWDLCNALDNCERWNGLGYRRMGKASPYIWAGTTNQQLGMYVADGQFDPHALDPRVGVASIFMALKAVFDVDLNEIRY